MTTRRKANTAGSKAAQVAKKAEAAVETAVLEVIKPIADKEVIFGDFLAKVGEMTAQEIYDDFVKNEKYSSNVRLRNSRSFKYAAKLAEAAYQKGLQAGK